MIQPRSRSMYAIWTSGLLPLNQTHICLTLLLSFLRASPLPKTRNLFPLQPRPVHYWRINEDLVRTYTRRSRAGQLQLNEMYWTRTREDLVLLKSDFAAHHAISPVFACNCKRSTKMSLSATHIHLSTFPSTTFICGREDTQQACCSPSTIFFFFPSHISTFPSITFICGNVPSPPLYVGMVM